MSFICDDCGLPQPVHSKQNHIVTKERKKTYPERRLPDGKTVIDKGGSGYEIVEERHICNKCMGIRRKVND